MGDWIKEQALVLETSNGLVIITGCAHPGIVNIVRKTRERFKDDVYLVRIQSRLLEGTKILVEILYGEKKNDSKENHIDH